MTGRRLALHWVCLLLAPLLVAWLGWSVPAALALVLLLLLWRWMISLSVFVAPGKQSELELETISASHFVEKVRWCMDFLGLDYTERPVAGTLGAFYLGRTVPVLHFRSGAVRSSIGNSMEILRYLWGRYTFDRPEQAEFLRADAKRLELEMKLDRVGANLQVWIYYHLLNDKQLCLHAWGVNNPQIPYWQRLLLRLLRPLQALMMRKAFRINDARHEQAVKRISDQLAEAEQWLSDGRESLLGGNTPNYTDLVFAALMGLWLRPANYGGTAGSAVQIEVHQMPDKAREQVQRWATDYPGCARFIREMYQHRLNASALAS